MLSMSELKQFKEESFEHMRAISDKFSGEDVYSEMFASKRKDFIDSMEYIKSFDTEIDNKTQLYENVTFRKEVYKFFIDSSLLTIIAKMVTDCPIDGDYSKTGDYEKRLLTLALGVLFDYTDGSDSLANEVAKTEVIESCKTILQTHNKQHVNDEITDLTYKIIDYCIGIVQNVSLRDCNVERLRSLDFTKVLQTYLKSPNEVISMSALTILANIVSEEECYIIGAHILLVARLLFILERGLEEDDRRFSGWSCKELGHAVKNLARNDANKMLLWNLNAVQILVEMARTGNDEEIYESVHAMWALAFDEKIRANITSSQETHAVDLLLDLQNKANNSSIRNACTKALCTLREELCASPILAYRTAGEEIALVLATQEVHKTHVMISYQTADREMLCKVKEVLVEHKYQVKLRSKHAAFTEQNTYSLLDLQSSWKRSLPDPELEKVWMDVDNMGGSTLQAMADAVENASVVLLCFSRRYKESDNCRLEAEYAHVKKKPIVPLKMEGNYKPDGWLGLMLGSKFYVDLSGKYTFEDGLKVLFKQLSKTSKQDGNTKHSPVEPALPKHVATQANKGLTANHALSSVDSIRQWSRDDVLEWLTQHDLRKQELEKLTGEEIALLVLMRIETPVQLYNCIREDLKIKTLQVTARLVLALLDLSRQGNKGS